DGDEEQQPTADRPDGLAVHAHGGTRDALADDAHGRGLAGGGGCGARVARTAAVGLVEAASLEDDGWRLDHAIGGLAAGRAFLAGRGVEALALLIAVPGVTEIFVGRQRSASGETSAAKFSETVRIGERRARSVNRSVGSGCRTAARRTGRRSRPSCPTRRRCRAGRRSGPRRRARSSRTTAVARRSVARRRSRWDRRSTSSG